MAREYGEYDPEVPLGVTWEESLQLLDYLRQPVDLTGYAVCAQFRLAYTELAGGVPVTDPVFEVTTAGFHVTPPAYPSLVGWTVPTPANGTLLLKVEREDLWLASPLNLKRALLWEVKLVNLGTDYAIPAVNGKAVFLRAGNTA